MLVTVVSGAVAFLSWHVFEVRFLQLKDYFTYSAPELKKSAPAISLDTHLPELTEVIGS